jgi:SAM-dependent methyltransferase
MTHHHHHTDNGYVERLRQFDRVLESMHREMVGWLNITPGSRVLDAGCGGGGVTKLLAEAVGDGGQVTALDIEAALLENVEELLADMPYAGGVSYEQASIDTLPFPDAAFDLVWCSRVIHHMPDQLAAVREIRRVLKPGGRFAMREDGFLMQLLPFDIGLGQPGLDERINAARAWEFARVRPSISDAVPYPFGWTQLLTDAGFPHGTVRSFVFEALPPFDDDLGKFVVRHWGRPLEEAETRARLSPEDQQVLEQLVDAHSPHFLLKRPDLHFVKVSTVHVGIR